MQKPLNPQLSYPQPIILSLFYDEEDEEGDEPRGGGSRHRWWWISPSSLVDLVVVDRSPVNLVVVSDGSRCG